MSREVTKIKQEYKPVAEIICSPFLSVSGFSDSHAFLSAVLLFYFFSDIISTKVIGVITKFVFGSNWCAENKRGKHK